MALGEALKKQGTEPRALSLKPSPRTSGAYPTFRHRTSPIRHPRCAEKIYSTKTPALRLYSHSLTTATVGFVNSDRTRPRLGPSLVS